MADINWSLGSYCFVWLTFFLHLRQEEHSDHRAAQEISSLSLRQLRDGDYFDLPKEKFQQMTVGQRLDHFAKRIVKHGRLRRTKDSLE